MRISAQWEITLTPMTNYTTLLMYLAGFLIVAAASHQLARYFVWLHLPRITGLLLIGIISGPYILGLLEPETVGSLNFVNEISLAFIAFAAGAELYLKELRSRFRSIGWNTSGQLVVVFFFTSIAIIYLSQYIPYLQDMDQTSVLAVSLFAGTIFVASSPSSTIAVINEMRAQGPLTQTSLGVTVLKDVLVIILFALIFSVSNTLVNGTGLDFWILLLIPSELLISFLTGYLLGRLLQAFMALEIHSTIKSALVLLSGYGGYLFSHFLKEFSTELGVELFTEPLLICIVASFYLSNYTRFRPEFLKILNELGPLVYIVFFTLVGANLALDIISQVWWIALILFSLRLLFMVISSYAGGIMAGDPPKLYRIGWMPYITQAGVSIGLATEVAHGFEWGPSFATIIISIIVINQLIGPPLFKWAIELAGESHLRAPFSAFEEERTAIIFGLEGQTIALARQLQKNGWIVKIASRSASPEMVEASDLDIEIIPGLTPEAFEALEADKAQTIVAMLTDDENYLICELAYEKLGTKELVVRINERANLEKFHKLGALVVDPSTAIVSLLDHFVRSPQATSLLLGLEGDQDTIDLEVQSSNLHGLTLRDLRLPSDVIVLSVNRRGQMIISHGYTRLRMGDIVTMVGSVEGLNNVALRFSE